jgi:hypothetical protein
VNEYRSVLERAGSNFAPLDLELESVLRRRDRKRRNQRIAAGVVGIAVFVAAVWIVTSGLPFDRSETPAATGPVETRPVETGPVETGPVETAPAPALASAAPDVVKEGTCVDLFTGRRGARWRLELTDLGDRILVRFEVHRSPVGHEWRITFLYVKRNLVPVQGHWFFRGTRVASDSGVFVVQLRVPDRGDGVDGRAVDLQTGEVCYVFAWGA